MLMAVDTTKCRSLEVLFGHLRYRQKREPEGITPAGSISSGLSTPTKFAHVCSCVLLCR